MLDQEKTPRRGMNIPLFQHWTIWPKMRGLQDRIALSYVWVTALLVLVLEILAVIGFAYLLLSIVAPFMYALETRQLAEHYALAAALREKMAELNPQSTFQQGHPGTLLLPGNVDSTDAFRLPSLPVQASGTRHFAFALLITPDGHVLASSDPHQYPLHMIVSTRFPNSMPLIAKALMGVENSGQDLAIDNSVYAAVPVWNSAMHPVGAIYVQITNLPSIQNIFELSSPLLHIVLVSTLLLLIILTPISTLFGIITMRGPIRRIHLLVAATTRFADGDYEQHVCIGCHDEIGQLERHFNHMAQQLAVSRQQQHILTDQNARLAERARMSRNLHDSVKQQVFALATQIGAASALLDVKREEAKVHLEVANELAYQVRQELTSLIQGFRPSIAVELGFPQVLQQYLNRWLRQNDIVADVQLQDIPMLPTTIAEELLRVVQEALSNVARHSQANCVQLSLVQEGKSIVLTISDNGCGFDPAKVSSRSLGLQSMKERLEELGGSFSLHSARGHGTQIVVSCPYKEESE